MGKKGESGSPCRAGVTMIMTAIKGAALLKDVDLLGGVSTRPMVYYNSTRPPTVFSADIPTAEWRGVVVLSEDQRVIRLTIGSPSLF